MKRVALLDGRDKPFSILVSDVAQPVAKLVFMPGACCRADRYTWLATALARAAIQVFIADPPESLVTAGALPERPAVRELGTLDQFHRMLALAREAAPARLVAGGHSQGACIVMEALDPTQARRNPRTPAGPLQPVPCDLDGAVLIAASMQPVVGALRFGWRDAQMPLQRPAGLPLLFLAGGADTVVNAESVAATARRYAPPLELVTLPGARHFDWTEGYGESDLVEQGDSDRRLPQSATVDSLERWIARLKRDAA